MAKIAFLFAGQGAQAPGMGKSLYENSIAAKEVFDVAESVRKGTIDDCFNANAQKLMQTNVTQICVHTVNMAAAAALEEKGVKAEGTAGFSLGEMAALTYAGVFDIKTSAQLVCQRAAFMDDAARENEGAMAAVLRLEEEDVEQICESFNLVWPVNYNCPGQTVVAGDAVQINDFCIKVKEKRGIAKKLAVSGAFHSPFMNDASYLFKTELLKHKFNNSGIPVFANLTGEIYSQPYADILALQMKSPVLWNKTIQEMKNKGFDTFIELGPGKTLSGFVKRIYPDANIYNVEDIESLAATVQALNS